MFNPDEFLDNLRTFIGFKTIVHEYPDEFEKARTWIKNFFDAEKSEFIEVENNGLTSLVIKPIDSDKPTILGDGHIEVVPGTDDLFQLVEDGGHLYGRGVADMKTQCLMMMTVLRDLIISGEHHDFWLLFTEDEEAGSANGVCPMVNYLAERSWLPHAVFAPDGGPDFAYVEKEKGIITFTAYIQGKASHASRPFLGDNPINSMMEFYRAIQSAYPNPNEEADWIPSLSMTSISGGEAYNKIPDSCEAGFDMRITEEYTVDKVLEHLQSIATEHHAEIDFQNTGMPTHYPQDAPIAKDYIQILREVSGKEPSILYSNGASNGRFYVAKDTSIHVLMSNPTVVGLHSSTECIVADSLPPYYELVRRTTQLI